MLAYLNSYIAARALKADVLTVDAHFSEAGVSDMKGVIYLKSALIALANLVEFELTIRSIYKDHRTLSASFVEHQKNYEFAKYLRNKMAGHLLPELVEKAVEWRPELRYMAACMENDSLFFIINLFLLETAINTYVDENGKHKIFESETDLIYPPNWECFLIFLEVSVRSAIHYLTELCLVLNAKVGHPSTNEVDSALWIKAGTTNFRFLKK